MKLHAKLPKDDVGAEKMRFEGIRTQRYTEIFIIGGSPIHLMGGVYNTVGLNDPDGTGDTSPQEILDGVDVDALTKEYHAMGAFKNGPRLWTLDWLEVMAGKERDFNGLKARWVTWLHVPKEMRKHEAVAYKVIGVKRDTQFGINAGSPAFLLDDPEGNTWCMKSASLIVDPNQTYESLKDLGQPPEARAGLELPDRRARSRPCSHARRRGRPDHAGRTRKHIRPGRRPVQQLQAVRGGRRRSLPELRREVEGSSHGRIRVSPRRRHRELRPHHHPGRLSRRLPVRAELRQAEDDRRAHAATRTGPVTPAPLPDPGSWTDDRVERQTGTSSLGPMKAPKNHSTGKMRPIQKSALWPFAYVLSPSTRSRQIQMIAMTPPNQNHMPRLHSCQTACGSLCGMTLRVEWTDMHRGLMVQGLRVCTDRPQGRSAPCVAATATLRGCASSATPTPSPRPSSAHRVPMAEAIAAARAEVGVRRGVRRAVLRASTVDEQSPASQGFQGVEDTGIEPVTSTLPA